MANILYLYAHPAERHSQVNVLIKEQLWHRDSFISRDLYSLYPHFFIDIEEEKSLLLQADVLILHHPVYWYSAPALLKEWIDQVLSPDFAFGHQGGLLNGKAVFQILTCGASKETYQSGRINSYPLEQFLLPWWQTFKYCSMDIIPPWVLYGVHQMGEYPQQQEYFTQELNLLLDRVAQIEQGQWESLT